jgi:hypothetical protein
MYWCPIYDVYSISHYPRSDFKRELKFRITALILCTKVVCFHEGPPFKFMKTGQDHTNFVQKVAYNPSGELLASGGADTKFYL